MNTEHNAMGFLAINIKERGKKGREVFSSEEDVDRHEQYD